MSRKSVKLTGFLSLRTSPMPNSVTASLKQKEKDEERRGPVLRYRCRPITAKTKNNRCRKEKYSGKKKTPRFKLRKSAVTRASHREYAIPLRREKRKKCSPPAPPFPMLCVVGLAIAKFFPENFGLYLWHNTSFPDRWPYAACLQVRR